MKQREIEREVRDFMRLQKALKRVRREAGVSKWTKKAGRVTRLSIGGY